MTFHRIGSVALSASVALAVSSQAHGAALWGVTGDGASTSESLFTISTSDASITFQTALGNGDDGEAIGFNPNNGLLYHMSGIDNGEQFFETVNPTTLAVGANISAGDTYGPGGLGEFTAMEWYEPLGVFLASNRESDLYHVATDGTFTNVGSTNYMRGFAVVGTRVYGIDPFFGSLFEVNPNDGSIINTLPLSLDGVSATGGNGLATDPDTGIVYAIVKNPAGGGRVLATIDVTTGAAAGIGSLGENFAGITFVPTPGAMAVLSMGGLIASRRRR